MKRYIKANTSKPELNKVQTSWDELDSGTGIMYTITSDTGEVLFEEVFDYQDVDPDEVYDSAAELAILSLSQQYDLTDEAIATIQST